MKGPGMRLRYDVRRLWECPTCNRRDLSRGDVVTRECICGHQSDPPRTNWMRLIAERNKPTPLERPAPVSADADSAPNEAESPSADTSESFPTP